MRIEPARPIRYGAIASAAIARVPTISKTRHPVRRAAGLGVTALPAITLAMFDRRGLVVREIEEPAVRRRIGVMKPKQRSLSAPARFLLEAVRAAFADQGRPERKALK